MPLRRYVSSAASGRAPLHALQTPHLDDNNEFVEGRWAADGDARIEATELYERYEGISPLYDDDDAFDAMMRAVWHLE